MARRSVRLVLAALVALAACSRLAALAPRASGPPFETVELVHWLNGKQDHVTIQYGRDGIRYVETGATTLLRYADRQVWRFDEKEKTVEQVSLDAFVQTQKVKTLQPDLPDLAGADARSAIQVDQTSEKSDFGGVAAHLVRIRGERFDVELWLSSDVALPGPRHETFELLQALGGPLAIPAVVFDHVSGFPVRSTVHVTGGMFDVRVTRSLLSMKPATSASDVVQVPTGYRRVDS